MKTFSDNLPSLFPQGLNWPHVEISCNRKNKKKWDHGPPFERHATGNIMAH